MLKGSRHLALATVTLLAVTPYALHAQPTQETELEILSVRFEPLRQGKNVVRIEVKNASEQDQVFRTHIYTRSPDYGRSGVGWGTGFFETIPASETKWTRLVFKVQGPVTESTYVRLTFSNPGSQEGFDEDAWEKDQGWNKWFKRTEYQARDLEWAREDSEESQPATAEQTDVIIAVFRRIQASIAAKDYTQAWQLFSQDYQRAEFQSVESDRFTKVMEPERPIDAALSWARSSFLDLQPVSVMRRNDKFVLLAETDGQTWTLDFADEDGQWKLDWLAGHTPLFLKWQNWEEHVLPKMEKRGTEHFDVHFFKGSTAEREIERLAQEKEKGYREICGFLGDDPQMRIRLVLFEDMRTKHWETGHQGMGWAYGNTIVEVYNETERLDPFHETAHVLMGPVGSPPALFNEGFAVYMSQRLGAHALEDLGGGTATIDERARELRAKGEWIELRELMTYTEIGSAESRPPIAYAEAASFVGFLIDTYDKERFLQAYKTLKNSSQPDVQEQNARALSAVYGQSLEQLRDAWEATLRRPATLANVPAPASASTAGREGETKEVEGTQRLTLYPAGDAEVGRAIRLLPGPQETSAGDAFTFYQKAIESLPSDLDWQRIGGWRGVALEELPLDEVGSTLRRCDLALELLERGSTCERCDWPVSYEDEVPPELRACRELSMLVALKARYHMARGEQRECARTLRTGFSLVRHLATGPTLLHLIIGAGVSGLMCLEVESFIEQPGVPSLESALRAIPKPLSDETHSEIYGLDEAGQDRVRTLLRRANRHIIVLQYIEALRLHATRAGQWPEALEKMRVDLPDDPVTGRPFTYRRLTETKAVLEGPLPEGGDAKDIIRYELDLARKS